MDEIILTIDNITGVKIKTSTHIVTNLNVDGDFYTYYIVLGYQLHCF